MPMFADNLFTLRGRVRMFRPNASGPQVDAWINDRIRQIIDSRTYWADLLATGVLSVPNQYITGTVSLTPGSAVVTGVSTAWPVSDVVNTTLSAAVTETNWVDATPTAMTGIAPDRTLYVDSTTSAEAVPVAETTGTTFNGKFTKAHAAGATVLCSSLAGRQFRLGVGNPIYTVRAVHSTTELELTVPWSGAAVSASAYQILGMYYTMAVDLKDTLLVLDPQQGIPIRTHVPLAEVNWRDPQRSSSGPPCSLVDFMPNECGNMQYELWPPQTSAYQIPYVYTRQWPQLYRDTDRPPWFLNPTVLVHGAIADALRFKVNKDDPFHNPALAREYEARFLQGVEDAKNADESKAQSAFQSRYDMLFGAGGANFWQSHDPDLSAWNV
jgi:hypothetical protein